MSRFSKIQQAREPTPEEAAQMEAEYREWVEAEAEAEARAENCHQSHSEVESGEYDYCADCGYSKT